MPDPSIVETPKILPIILGVVGAITGVVGAVTGSIALIWRVVDEFGAFLRIAVQVNTDNASWITILTTVDYKGNRAKKINYSILLVGPEEEDPVITMNNILANNNIKIEKKIQQTNDFEYMELEDQKYASDRVFIPLKFFYDENIDIADETLTYSVPIERKWFRNSRPYSARFFVFGTRWLHRSTQDLFILTAQSTNGPERGKC
jgi:hypothetical protein